MHPIFSTLVRAAMATPGVGAITITCSRILPVNAATVGFFYLMLILGVATVWGLTESAICSVVAVLCYNYFFLPPVGQFTIADPQNWVALLTFLMTASVASHLSNRAKAQNLEAKRRQRETEQLYALSRAILLTDSAQPIQQLQRAARPLTNTSILRGNCISKRGCWKVATRPRRLSISRVRTR